MSRFAGPVRTLRRGGNSLDRNRRLFVGAIFLYGVLDTYVSVLCLAEIPDEVEMHVGGVMVHDSH